MELWSLESLIALITLAALEIVLGIDNIIFIAVVTNRLPQAVQAKARRLGLALALISRLALLFAISLIMKLGTTLLTLFGHDFSGRDMVLIAGGFFLLSKSTLEIHDKIEDHGHTAKDAKRVSSMAQALIQIVLLDVIFSLDSVITAVGMARHIPIMAAAIVLAVIIMMFFAEPVSHFVNKHPTVQMLAFSFLILVGVVLVAEGLGKHIDRGYVYFAMAFSFFVEMLNLRLRKHPEDKNGSRASPAA